VRIDFGRQRTGGPPRAPANAIGGIRTGMRQRADRCRAGQLSNDEKITRFDAAPHTGTDRLLPRIRDDPFCVAIPPLLYAYGRTARRCQNQTRNYQIVKFLLQ
jgi:hypothetical protein